MATPARHLCRSFIHLSRNVPSKRSSIQQNQRLILRPFSSAPIRRADEPSRASQDSSALQEEPIGETLDESEYLTPEQPYTRDDLSPAERADYEVLSREDQKQYMKLQNHFKAIFERTESKQGLEALADREERELEREGGSSVTLDFVTARAKGPEIGYWAEDEEDEFGQMPDADNEWREEHITSVAESELDLHRDVREYTRIAAWDLPLLQQYAKPFQPPNHSTPLRFRYTTYMGETHPAQHKVVVEFCTKDLLQNPNAQFKLTEPQRIKLLKLVGVRYNPSTDVVKMSCEKFGSAAQNKRYLGELVGKLIKEAKDKRDMFEDVALDLRHYKSKKRPVYPESWKLRGKTVQKVLETRQELKLLGEGEVEDAEPVDGRQLVASYVRVGNVKPSRTLPR